MARKPNKNKTTTTATTDKTEKIVAAALAHPTLGPSRLSKLLKDEGLDVARQLVYRILRGRGLQTRKLRIQFLEQHNRFEKTTDTPVPSGAPKSPPEPLQRQTHESSQPLFADTAFEHQVKPSPIATKEKPEKVTAELADRIVESAKANPTLGPVRLANLLKDEGVVVSRGLVYRVLRSKGLQTRKLRACFQEEPRIEKSVGSSEFPESTEVTVEPIQEQARETPGPPVFIPGIEYSAIASAKEKTEAPARVTSVYIPTPVGAPIIEHLKKTHPGKERWLFGGINLLLAFFLVYFGVRIGLSLYDQRQESGVTSTYPYASHAAADTVQTAESKRPMRDYRVIMDRNLFGSASQSASDPARETADLKAIRLAGNEIGLKLIGTAVGKDRRQNYAVLEVTKTRSQEILREKQTIDKVLIKRILRNNVIIQTASGEKRLSLDETPGGGTSALPVQPAAVALSFSEVPRVDAYNTGARFEISRNEIAQTLPSLRQMIEESNSSENRPEGNPDGFSVGRLRARDAFFRIGLRSGDVIKSVDGEAVQSGDDAEQLIERLAEGGDFSIMVERRGQLESLNLTVR